jgi:hypothetical protein
MTLVKTIQFETYYRNDNGDFVVNEYLVENNEDNFTKIAQSRFTRGIQFGKMFDFEFEKKEAIPFEMIDPRIWLAMTEILEDAINQDEELLNELHAQELREMDERGELDRITDDCPSVAEVEEVNEEVIEEKKGYRVYEKIGKTIKRGIAEVNTMKEAREMCSKLRMNSPSRKYGYSKN